MNTGRELDALVSARVFGRAYERHERVWINDREVEVETWLPAGSDPRRPPPGVWAGYAPPRYSTDMAVAWRLVEKMAADGWEVSVTVGGDGRPDVQAFHMERAEHGQGFVQEAADTAPHAICLAALSANGVELRP